MFQKQEEEHTEEIGEERHSVERMISSPREGQGAEPRKKGWFCFLMKRLWEGQRFVYSGDYNVVKTNMKKRQLPGPGRDSNSVTANHIPSHGIFPTESTQLSPASLLMAKMKDAAWDSAEHKDTACLGAALAPVLPAFAARCQKVAPV